MEHCAVFNNDTRICERLVLASRISGSVSLIFSVFVLCLLLLYKYYREFDERIILNTQFSVFFTSIAFISNAGYKNEILCSFLGIFTSYVGWNLTLWAFMFTLSFVMKIGQLKFHDQIRKRQWVTYLIGWGIPIVPAFLPLINAAYGHAGFSCWITSVEWQWGGYHAWLMALILCMLGMYAYIVYKLVKFFNVYKGTGQNEVVAEIRKKVKERVIAIAGYPLAFLSLSTVPFINRMYNTFHKPNYDLFMAHAIISPLRGVIFSVIFAIDLFYSKRLSFTQIKTDLKNLSLDSEKNDQGTAHLNAPEEMPTVMLD